MKSKPKTDDPIIYATGVGIGRVLYELNQDSDSCEREDLGQTLKVSTDDAGGGSFIILKTERWAIDSDCIDKFAAMLKEVVNIPTYKGG